MLPWPTTACGQTTLAFILRLLRLDKSHIFNVLCAARAGKGVQVQGRVPAVHCNFDSPLSMPLRFVGKMFVTQIWCGAFAVKTKRKAEAIVYLLLSERPAPWGAFGYKVPQYLLDTVETLLDCAVLPELLLASITRESVKACDLQLHSRNSLALLSFARLLYPLVLDLEVPSLESLSSLEIHRKTFT